MFTKWNKECKCYLIFFLDTFQECTQFLLIEKSPIFQPGPDGIKFVPPALPCDV